MFRAQPRWVLPGLAVILLLAGTLYSWRLGASGYSSYYASAAKSMSSNGTALVFGALDPAAHWTLDKLSGFLVPAAIAVKLFGFHAWVLDLPQVIEGLVTIVASYVIGARWRGPAVGLGVAAIMATTPLLAAMFGHPTEDALLTITMVLAFAAWQRAVQTNRIGWLVLAGLWVAVGFQAKMLQAWLIVPALLIGFVIGASGPLRGRLLRALVAGVVTALLSLSWTAAIQLVPASDRPYIDGTTNNNAFSMVFGYNGVDRVLPGAIPGAVPQLASHAPTRTHGGTATQQEGGSPTKLLLPEFTTQIGWLYPTAAVGAVIELAAFARRRRAPTDDAAVASTRADRATPLTAVIWFAVTAVVLSAAFVPHATYFAVIALPLALLAAAGAAHALRNFTVASGRSRFLLPALGAVQTAWAAWIAFHSPAVTRGLGVLILVLGVVGVVAALLATRGHRDGALAGIAVAALVLSGVLGPGIWSSFVLGPGGSGSASDAYAGPRRVTEPPRPADNSRALMPASIDGRAEPVVDYVRAHGAEDTLFATDVLAIAVAVNLDSGQEVLPMGGFSGQAPWPTARALAQEIDAGRLRYVLLEPRSRNEPANATLDDLRQWVNDSCRPVLHGAFREGSRARQTLYDCRA